MASGPRGPGRRGRRPAVDGVTALAREWAWELAASGVYQLTRAELELALRRPVRQLVEMLLENPFRPRRAREIGAILVGLHANSGEALRRTYLVLVQRFPPDGALTEVARRGRLDHLLAELITGWVDAARAETLDAQESTRTAIDTVRQQASNPWFEHPEQ
jgi:hypothetical protein